MKVKDIDKLMEQLHNDKREAFSKHEVWLMLSEHNTKVPTVDVGPSADAVEVVRCKDCKHRHEDECPMQFEEQFDIDEGDGYYDTEYIFHDYTQDDGYCSWGERREP